MKIVALWLAAVTVAVVTFGSCSVNHRSGEFACRTDLDCASDRFCANNLCVLNNPVDAGGIDNGGCPANCTSCDGPTHTCVIECLNNDVCRRPIVCAPGWNCAIHCDDDSSCRAGIDCRDAASCDVMCNGDMSCRNATCGDGTCTFACNGMDSCTGIACGTGACKVDCNGTDSCEANNGGAGFGVNCSNACACDVTCGFDSACAPVVCPAGCDDIIDGCTSTRTACNTCP